MHYLQVPQYSIFSLIWQIASADDGLQVQEIISAFPGSTLASSIHSQDGYTVALILLDFRFFSQSVHFLQSKGASRRHSLNRHFYLLVALFPVMFVFWERVGQIRQQHDDNSIG